MKIAINGLGRIGRSILRQIAGNPEFELVFLNDPNMSAENLSYLIKYDSTYGRINGEVSSTVEGLCINGRQIDLLNCNDPSDFPQKYAGIDLIIESSGLKLLGASMKELISKGFTKKIICTYSNPKHCDASIVAGVNDEKYDAAEDNFISGTICDVVSLSPIISAVQRQSKINGGNIVTLHPWLSYQNLVDGPVASVSSPGHAWPDFALGRASSENLIPKNTTVLDVLAEIFPNLPYSNFQSMSFRIPTATVTSSIINIRVAQNFDIDKFHNDLLSNKYLEVITENLVSSDFKGAPYGASIDTRWTELVGDNLRVISWYDNEFGYSSQMIQLALLALGK